MKKYLLISLMLVLPAQQLLASDIFNGEKIYKERCARCHGETGYNPYMSTVPNFAIAERMVKSDRELLTAVEYGKGTMPGFKGILERREMLDVISYIRTLF